MYIFVQWNDMWAGAPMHGLLRPGEVGVTTIECLWSFEDEVSFSSFGIRAYGKGDGSRRLT